ncbi:MAG: hypothetical protein V9G12_09420 [Microthrixaceae bacterium]
MDSFETEIDVDGLDAPFHAVFIRAPIIERTGDGVQVLAAVGDNAVFVRRGPSWPLRSIQSSVPMIACTGCSSTRSPVRRRRSLHVGSLQMGNDQAQEGRGPTRPAASSSPS